MRFKSICTNLTATAFLAASVTLLHAEEGKIDFVYSAVGQSTILPVSQGTMQINYATNGLSGQAGTEGPNAPGGMHCVGAATVMAGKFENESGLCRVTYADGSVTLTHYSGAGVLGRSATGTWSYLGGSGAFEGITGGGEWSRMSGPSPSEGTIASQTAITGTYKLP